MSSTIFYRFKSQKDYSRISFDASQMGLNVFDIKRDIIQTEKLGTGADFDLKISNADSNQGTTSQTPHRKASADILEYDDDAETIPRGTSVIVQRKPPSRGPGKGSAARYVTGNAIQISSRQEFKKPNAAPSTALPPRTAAAAPPPPPVPGSSEDEAIRAMLMASSDQWQETQDRMALSKPVYRPGVRGMPSGPVPDRPLPQGYICYRCGQKGHYIQACPTNGDETFENRKRIKRTTGIPRSQLQKVDNPTEDSEGNVMVNADGESVMFVPDSASWETYQKNTQNSKADELPEGSTLGCGICKKLMQQPVSVPCCNHTYCEDCIQGALLESDFVCPQCGTKDMLLDKLVAETEIEKDIQAYLAAKPSDGTDAAQDADGQQAKESVNGTETGNTTTEDANLVTPASAAAAAAAAGATTTDPTLAMPPFPMPPFDPMMMGMMGFPPMGFPSMPGMPPMPNFGFPPMPGMPPMPPMPGMPGMPNTGGAQSYQHQASRHPGGYTNQARNHPYSRPPPTGPARQR